MKVEILNVMGSDLTVVNAARVSYNKESLELTEKDIKLITYLYEHKHTAPFRHPQIQMRISCPIFVERQLFKHQSGLSANSISGRYVDFSDEYEHIEQFRKQSISSKQGSSENLSYEENQLALQIQASVIRCAKIAYTKLIELGVAKEQARTVLPLALQTTFIWTGSLLAFLHLLNLRLKPDAQAETREVAKEILQQLRILPNEPFKYSLKAFGFD